MESDRIDSMRMELRRGVLALAVLAALCEEHYGYSLRKTLIAAGIDIEEGTLYPLMRRLEGYGLLQSEWREGEGRRRRFYLTSELGRSHLEQLQSEWKATNRSLRQLLRNAP